MPYTEIKATVYYEAEMMLNRYVVINERERGRDSVVAPRSTKTCTRAQAATARERGRA